MQNMNLPARQIQICRQDKYKYKCTYHFSTCMCRHSGKWCWKHWKRPGGERPGPTLSPASSAPSFELFSTFNFRLIQANLLQPAPSHHLFSFDFHLSSLTRVINPLLLSLIISLHRSSISDINHFSSAM